MRATAALSALIACLGIGNAFAQPGREIFLPPPPQTPAPAVVVVAGSDGSWAYRSFAARLAKAGYYTVLVGGWDIAAGWGLQGDGARYLAPVIAAAVSDRRALPGKAALVGFSIGGLIGLRFSGELADQLSAVVAYYPALALMGNDMKPLARRLGVPALVLAGAKDRYLDCCPISMMRSLESAARAEGKPFELMVYPDAQHAFNLPAYTSLYRKEDAEDAWQRTLAFLKEHHAVPADLDSAAVLPVTQAARAIRRAC